VGTLGDVRWSSVRSDDGLRPNVLVTDHLMLGMSGTELARILAARSAALSVLIVSGYAESEGIAPDLPRLTTPFRNDDLAAALAALAIAR
jgi:FixJ family two-component response regulator